jgi:hypothetical protein
MLIQRNNEGCPYDPLLVKLDDQGLPLSADESVLMWKELGRLPEETQQLLVSDAVAEKMMQVQRMFRVDHENMLRISVLVRYYYFQKISLQEFQRRMEASFGRVVERFGPMLAFLVQEVLTLRPKPKDAEEGSRLVESPLLDALAKYPRLNDQAVTGSRIRVKSEKEPVRPSVRNWLRAYRDVLGVRRHTAVERGRFLFQSENAKRLAAEERERLAALLGALDDGTPLAVDPARQEIVFSRLPAPAALPDPGPLAGSVPLNLPVRESGDVPVAASRPAPSVSYPNPSLGTASDTPIKSFNFATSPTVSRAQSVRFSSGHVLPAEKDVLARVSPSSHDSTLRASGVYRADRPESFGRILPSSPSVPSAGPAQRREVWQVPAELRNDVGLRRQEES